MSPKTALRSFSHDRRGVAAIEYVVLSSAIAMAIVSAVGLTGTGVSTKFNALGGGTTATAVAVPVAVPVAVTTPIEIQAPIAIARPIGRPIMMPIAISPVAMDF